MRSTTAIHAVVDPEIHDSWHRFADEQGVTVSAIVGVLGIWFGSDEYDDEAAISVRDLTMAARKYAAKQRRRGGARAR